MNDKLNINLLGTSFNLSSDKSIEYLNEVYSKYKKIVKKIKNDMEITDPLTIAILAGLMATDKYDKSISDSEKLKNNLNTEESIAVERITGQLITKIDNCLSSDKSSTLINN